MYGRRFLRMVFSRALESGMDEEGEAAGSGPSTIPNGSVSGSHQLRQRKQRNTASSASQRPPPNPLATKRLRAASFLPRFVEQEPLHRNDPRAIRFAEVSSL